MPIFAIAKDFTMFILFIITLLTISISHKSIANNTPNITVNVNNNWNSTNSNQNSNTTEITSTEVKTVIHRIKSFIDNEIPHHYTQARLELWKYRYHMCSALLITAYGILCYHLNCGVQFIKHKTVWASWHQELDMQSLLACDLEKITQELLIAIQMHYSNEHNPTDFILPLVEFSTAIQSEINTLNFYAKLYHWCDQWRLTSIMPISTQLLNQLPEYIERATYIQTLFKNWTAHHNLACHMQCQQPPSITYKIKAFFGL